MSRSAEGADITFLRTSDGLLLSLQSPKWKLERGKAYAIRLMAGSRSVEAKALAESKAVTIALADRAPLTAARHTLGIHTSYSRRLMSVALFEGQRQEMIAAIRVIAQHLADEIGKTALDDRVLLAMAKVPRHEFVPIEVQPYAYLNRPLPIGFDKTISQPLMVAVMTDLLELTPDDMVLEIGTGLGYQSAVLAELAGKVYTVEIIDELAQQAEQRLKREGYTNVEVRIGNGYFGWPERAPFDKVIVTAAPDLIPPPLINQLKPGGKMVIPVGLPDAQHLVVVNKDINGRVRTKEIMRVLFSVLEGPDQIAFRAS
jgi:protein-L-isoaspartate(D-aspartate) O-methyltransferase